MNFSVHLSDGVLERLNRATQESGKTRNSIIREAVDEWLVRRQPDKWPPIIQNFRGIKSSPRFEASRKELKRPRNPFDALSS